MVFRQLATTCHLKKCQANCLFKAPSSSAVCKNKSETSPTPRANVCDVQFGLVYPRIFSFWFFVINQDTFGLSFAQFFHSLIVPHFMDTCPTMQGFQVVANTVSWWGSKNIHKIGRVGQAAKKFLQYRRGIFLLARTLYRCVILCYAE